MSEALCDICRAKPARLHFTEIRDGQKTEMELCEGCAMERGLGFKPKAGKIAVAPTDILSEMLHGETEPADPEGLACPGCGLPYAEFKRLGRLGCAQCYTAFQAQLGGLLQRIHGTTRHVGRTPLGQPGLEERQLLLKEKRAALREAVAREDFEAAATLRDECKRVEREMDLLEHDRAAHETGSEGNG